MITHPLVFIWKNLNLDHKHDTLTHALLCKVKRSCNDAVTSRWYHIFTSTLPLHLRVSKMVWYFSFSHFIIFFSFSFLYSHWVFHQHKHIITEICSSYYKHVSINEIYIYFHMLILLHFFVCRYILFYIQPLFSLLMYHHCVQRYYSLWN